MLKKILFAGMALLFLGLQGDSLIANGTFDAGKWEFHAAPAGWRCIQGNHRILKSGDDGNPGLRLQKIWPGSTVPAVWQEFQVPAGTAMLRLSIGYETAEGAAARVRIRQAGGSAKPGEALFYNGTAWVKNTHAWDYSKPPAGGNPYTRGDIMKIEAEYSFRPAAREKADFSADIPVPEGIAKFQLELGVGGKATGEKQFGTVYYRAGVEALDASGAVLAAGVVGSNLDADKILAKPPLLNVEFRDVGDTRAAFIDGKPCSLLGWSSIINHNIQEATLKMMLAESDFPTARLVAPLGDPIPKLDYGAPSWQGPDIYNWSYLNQEIKRMLAANPEIKIMLTVVFDYPKWWSRVYPDATDSKGRADYLSDDWLREGRKALRQLIAHLESGPYAGVVIGYTLFNGVSLDCNWAPDINTPAAVKYFREFLRKRYVDDAALQKAWADSSVTLAGATPSLEYRAENEKYPLIFEPGKHRRVADSIEFSDWTQNHFMHNFAAIIKEATHHRRLVGFRTGNLFYGAWNKGYGGYGQSGQWGSDRSMELLDDPNVDFFDQWDPYPGRGLGDWGSFEPVIPTRGIIMKGKAVVLQDDVRPHVGTDKGYGATANATETLSKQKKVFLNAMARGMNPYLWQMSFTYAIPEIMPLWRQLQDIWMRSFRLPRKSVAEIAIVADADMQRFIGRELEYQNPTRGFALLDYGRFTWSRAGAGYDMIFLDQVAGSKYKVYIFFHTFKTDPAQIEKIHETMRANNAVAFFVWNDGIFDASEVLAVANASRLAGINLSLSPVDLSWRMTPEKALVNGGFDPKRNLGVLDRREPSDSADAVKRFYPPTLVVSDSAAVPLGRSLDDSKSILLAQKKQNGWTSIYSFSPVLAPGLLRYAVRQAGVFEYLAGDDALYVTSDFIGVHTRSTTREITLRLPEKGPLYELFHHWELPADNTFTVKVKPNETYWFFRGTREQWQGLK